MVYNKYSFFNIKILQRKYLNNIVEQDHSFIKWRIQNVLGFKSLESARRTFSEIEVMNMLRKKQMLKPGATMFKSFCKMVAFALALYSREGVKSTRLNVCFSHNNLTSLIPLINFRYHFIDRQTNLFHSCHVVFFQIPIS